MPRKKKSDLSRISAKARQARRRRARQQESELENRLSIQWVWSQQPVDDTKKTAVHRRRWLTLEEKLKIINANDNGKTCGKIAREYGMNESSVRLIIRKKDFYKSLGQAAAFRGLKSFAQQRTSLLGEVERQLLVWINEKTQNSVHLSETEIQKRALDLFNEFKLKYGITAKFSASRGWLRRFQKRICVQKCIQTMDALPSIDEAAEQFRFAFQNLVREEGYTHHQIFNVEEMILFWKKIPGAIFETDFEKNQPARDKLCILLGSNAAGDFKLKPLVNYRAPTPAPLEDCEKDSLPVMWRWNKNKRLTQDLFQEWFTSYFCPAVEQYCTEHGLEFKVLLVLDPTCSHNIIHHHPNVKILFLPKHISKFLQPMNLGIFSLLKAQYQRLISQNMASSPDLQSFYCEYNIKNAIENIYTCWADTEPENLAATWHQLLPDVKTRDFESQIAAVAQEVVNIDQQLGIKTDMQNFQNYLEVSVSETSSDQYPKFEEVIVCKEEIPDTYEEEDDYDEDPNMEDLAAIIQNIDAACELIMMNDPDPERSIKARQCLQEGVRCYRDLYSSRTTQSDSFENSSI